MSAANSTEDAFALPAPETGRRRYFFDTSDGLGFVQDEEGLALDALAEAPAVATRALAEMERGSGKAGEPMNAEVGGRDEAGKRVLLASCTITVSELS